jgi:hypothetical protein
MLDNVVLNPTFPIDPGILDYPATRNPVLASLAFLVRNPFDPFPYP